MCVYIHVTCKNVDAVVYAHIHSMCISCLQFVQRILIIFIPDKYKPDEPYVRHIPNRRLHLYTLVQIIMLFILCVFKVVTQISIIFPIMVSTDCNHVHVRFHAAIYVKCVVCMCPLQWSHKLFIVYMHIY